MPVEPCSCRSPRLCRRELITAQLQLPKLRELSLKDEGISPVKKFRDRSMTISSPALSKLKWYGTHQAISAMGSRFCSFCSSPSSCRYRPVKEF
ncbi:hypothetical protein HPP92_019225 [Vanilla planifolia]|uniref:Uncharacterized protein n=1 Tax=Vanilla planifolia TaxID=51239 RepID=A0A835Q6J0_VANPL|nr:hypothetical protein HPP92_019225 [Vanilla planifolia]